MKKQLKSLTGKLKTLSPQQCKHIKGGTDDTTDEAEIIINADLVDG